MKLNHGFTLAEVLITLGIIGVVASFTTPILLHTMPSSNKMIYRKIYADIGSVLSNMFDDEVNYPLDETNTALSLPKGFDYTDYTTNSISGTKYNKFCYFFSKRLSTVGAINNIADTQTGSCSFTTIDGASWRIYIPVSDTTSTANNTTAAAASAGAAQFPIDRNQYSTKIALDVNGNVKPNCSRDTNANTYGFNYSATCKDADQFVLGVRYDGKLQVGSGITGGGNSYDTYAVGILSNLSDLSKN